MGSISTSRNKAVYLDKPEASLVVRDAPFPKAEPGEIVVRNAVIAINPVTGAWPTESSSLSSGLPRSSAMWLA
jgi:hypothetical protein